MRAPMRETGSIHVRARRDVVLDILQRHVGRGALVRPDRLEARGSTYVLRESAEGTHIFHAREEDKTLALRRRDELRLAVQADLFQVQRLVEASRRP